MNSLAMLGDIKKRFIENDIDIADAEWLFCEVLNCKRSELKKDIQLSKRQQKMIDKYAKQRCKHIPLDRILKKSNFFGYDFLTSRYVLLPRPETEGLVELVSKNIKEGSTGLDIGTGSGAIAIVLQKKFGMKMNAIDISTYAVKLAQKNAKKHGVDITIQRSNLFDHAQKSFDFIVSNPPYIRTEDIKTLQPEVKVYEPKLAINGGKNGLLYYEKISMLAPKYLNDGGKLFFEIGCDQANDVCDIMTKNFTDIVITKDLEGKERYVFGTKIQTKEMKQ